MNKIRYETPANVRAEREFAKEIEDRFHCQYHKFPIDWQIDGVLSRNKEGVAFAELKCRSHTRHDYSTVFLSKHKAETGLKFSRHFGHVITGRYLPFIFFVRFVDQDMFLEIKPEHIQGARLLDAKNHNETDLEYVIELPLIDFKEF